MDCRALAALGAGQQQSTGAPPLLGLPSTMSALTPRMFANSDNLVSCCPTTWTKWWFAYSMQAVWLSCCFAATNNHVRIARYKW